MGRNILAVVDFVLVTDLSRLRATIFDAPIVTPVEATETGTIVAVKIEHSR